MTTKRNVLKWINDSKQKAIEHRARQKAKIYDLHKYDGSDPDVGEGEPLEA